MAFFMEDMMELKEFFAIHPKAALAFSGGTDSAYLLYAAKKYGCDVRPYFIKTAFQPEFELQDAKRLAQELKAELKIIELDILAAPEVTANPADRCYHCKKRLFSALVENARRDGYTELIDGTNASDEAGDRPGMRVLQEMRVLSPLRLCGITKSMVRELSKEAGLFTWEKPSYACLATRIPTGVEICAEQLCKVEAAEEALKALGFKDFRVRVFNGAARLQVTEQQFMLAAQNKDRILSELAPMFNGVMLDLAVRNGG